MPDIYIYIYIYVIHTATLSLRCSSNINMNKEVMRDKRVCFFCSRTLLKIYFYNAFHICNSSQYDFPFALLLQAIHFASQSL